MLDHKAIMLPLKVYMHTNEICVNSIHIYHLLEIANGFGCHIILLFCVLKDGIVIPCRKHKQAHKLCNFKVKFGKVQGYTKSSVETQSGVIS